MNRREFLNRRERNKLKDSRLRAEQARLYKQLQNNSAFKRLIDIRKELEL